jgi:hypothetical protein
MTTPKVNWSERDQKYWVYTDEEPLWFESVLDAQAAAHRIEIENAVKAREALIAEWLRRYTAYMAVTGWPEAELKLMAEASYDAWPEDDPEEIASSDLHCMREEGFGK